jgi:threonine/homoserine/homoserine lactone efflux protein
VSEVFPPLTSVLAFSLAAAVLTVTPGADTMLVLRTAVVGGRRRGVLAGLGVCTGLFVWGAAAGLGLTALVLASRLAYDGLRLAGAAYLLYLAGSALRGERATDHVEPTVASGPYRRGLLTNVLNPKVGAFYLTFLPQFIPRHSSVLACSLLFAGMHALEGVGWLSAVSVLSDRLGHLIRRRRVRRWLDRLSAAVFVGLAARLAAD